MKKLFILTLLFCGSLAFLGAQNYSTLFVFGFSVPQGDFADDDYYDAIFDGDGYAGTGITLGLKVYEPMKTEGLSYMFSLGLLINPMHGDFKDDFEDDWDGDVNYPKYLNIPVLMGLNYKYPVAEKINLFGEAGLGVNCLWISNLKISDDDFDLVYKFSPSFKLGYTIGGGVVIQDTYTIGLNFLGLGSHKSKYKWEEDWDGDKDHDDDKFDKSLDVGALTLTLGLKI